jgi:hypothetical protein
MTAAEAIARRPGRVDRAVRAGLLLLGSLHGCVEATGALCWVAGAVLLWTGRAVSAITPRLAAFLVLAVAGEHLELSRILRHGPRGPYRPVVGYPDSIMRPGHGTRG